jgi:hypothetical protein
MVNLQQVNIPNSQFAKIVFLVMIGYTLWQIDILDVGYFSMALYPSMLVGATSPIQKRIITMAVISFGNIGTRTRLDRKERLFQRDFKDKKLK